MTERDIVARMLDAAEAHTTHLRKELLTMLRQSAADLTHAATPLEHSADPRPVLQRLDRLQAHDAHINRLAARYAEALTQQDLRDLVIAAKSRA